MAAWNDATKNLARAIQWWAQVALSAAFATAPVITVGVYLGTVDAVVVTFLIAVAAIVTAVVAFAVLGRMKHALGSLLACTVAGAFGLLVVVPHQAGDHKNMAPFLVWAGKQLPAAEPVYALGRIDETLRGIVPFTTGRPLVPVTAEEVAASRPDYVLVQDSDGSDAGASLPDTYRLIGEHTYGTDRRFALWRASAAVRRIPPADAGGVGTELPIN